MHVFTKHLYITCHIYRYKQYIAYTTILRTLITFTKTAMILIINDIYINNNNYNCNKNKIRS